MATPRDGNALRPLFLKVGVNPSAAGSAYVEMGATKVMAAVYGPREGAGRGGDFSAAAALECDVRFAPFASRPRRERTGASLEAERQASQALEAALRPALLLERYPKSVIEVYATVLESDGGDESACLVAAALAAADAGLDMVDLPASVGVAGRSSAPGGAPADGAAPRSSSSGSSAGGGVGASAAAAAGGDLAVDPTAHEAAGAPFTLVAALMPRVGLLTRTSHTGEAPADTFVRALGLAMDGCVTVFTAMRATLRDAAGRRHAKSVAAGPLISGATVAVAVTAAA